MAEGEGFEPSVQALIPYSGLANRRFRPLSHPSTNNYKLTRHKWHKVAAAKAELKAK